jgi:general secretion pathway protein D
MKIVIRIFCLLAVIAMTACATGRTSFDKGQELERMGKYDEAVLKYAEAVSNNSEMSEYRLAFLKASETAAKLHLESADKFFAAKRYDEAYREYESAMVMNPSQGRAKQQMDVISKHKKSSLLFAEGAAYEKENKSREAVRSYQSALNLNPNNREAAEAVERLLKTRKIRAAGFELNLTSTKPITLKFKDAKIKDVFNIITKLSGINFVFDEGMKDTNVTIYLENATFQQALDIICGMNKLQRKVLNESTVIVYPKSAEKSKQYEDLYVQTFFLNKLDAKKAVNLIRTMLQVKKIYVNEEMNTLVIRDSADVIEVARRILEANDVPDAEVVLEVEVIEVSKRNAESFGLALSRYAVDLNVTGPSGKFLNSTFVSTDQVAVGSSNVEGSGGNTGAAGATLTRSDTSQLVNLFRWGDYNGYITVPSATFNFGKTLGNAETLSNPKMRVKNREKAKFNVGTRVPITTTSTNGTTSGYSVNVQYVDVGVKVNAEPTIQLNNDVSIKLGLEVSSILSREKIGSDNSTTVVTIGTRNMDTVLSLKDGETTVIGGLIQDTKGQSTQKVFFLGDIPVIGQFFSNKENSTDKTELILAITPRIVRGITVADPEIASFWSGVEDDPSLARQYESFAQEPEFTAPAAEKPAAQPPQKPLQDLVQPLPVAPQAQPAIPVIEQKPVVDSQQPAVAPDAGSPDPSELVVSQPVQLPPPPVATVPPPQARRASLSVSAPAVVKQDQQFSADIMIAEASNLFSAPFKVVYDPALLEILTVTEGDIFNKDGKPSNFTAKIENASGILDARFFREKTSGGVSGTGKLFSINFKAKAPGAASIGFTGIKLTGEGYKLVESTPYNTVIEVKTP